MLVPAIVAPGILRWAVEGFELWREKGLEPPDAVKAASEEYRNEQDVLADFLADKCKDDPDATVPAGELYKAYVEWCETEKIRERDRLGNRAFGAALSERGIKGGRKHGGRFYEGLTVKA